MKYELSPLLEEDGDATQAGQNWAAEILANYTRPSVGWHDSFK